MDAYDKLIQEIFSKDADERLLPKFLEHFPSTLEVVRKIKPVNEKEWSLYFDIATLCNRNSDKNYLFQDKKGKLWIPTSKNMGWYKFLGWDTNNTRFVFRLKIKFSSIIVYKFKDKMETKEVKIEIPEGYEIDEVRSSFTKIVFKRKITKPTSWDEYLKEGNHPSPQYYIKPLTGVKRTDLDGCCGDLSRQPDSCKMYLPTRELADKFLVYMQIMSLYKAWVGNWNNTLGHCIRISADGTILVTSGLESTPLRFPTKEMALEFRACFKHLLEQAKGLY